MWNEFKERFMQWFEKIKAVFLEEAQQMDPIRDQFENFEKRVILGNGAQAKIRIGLSEDATRIFEVEKAAYDGESPWAKDVLEKDVAHNPAAIYIVLEVEEEIVGFIGARTTEGTDLHITNVAVLHDYRFLNVATLLLKALEKSPARSTRKKLRSKPACRIQKLLSSIEKMDTRLLVQRKITTLLKMKMLWKCSMHYRQKRRLHSIHQSIHLQDYIQLI